MLAFAYTMIVLLIITSVLLYSLFTAACGLAQTIWQLALFRFLLGLGMGGAWTAGAALVSESWPDRHRGKAIGLMQSAWAIGYGGAALLSAFVLPRYGWRAMFFIGGLPALTTLWIRGAVTEPDIWQKRDKLRGSLAGIFKPPYRRITISMVTLSLCCLLNGMQKSASARRREWSVAFVAYAHVSVVDADHRNANRVSAAAPELGRAKQRLEHAHDRFGRRPSFVTYLLSAAALVLLYGATQSPVLLLGLGPFVGFFGTGYMSGFGSTIAELYPTAVRAAATGFTFNIGRVASALAPFMIGSLAQTRGFGLAFATAALALVLGAMTWAFIPETRGKALT